MRTDAWLGDCDRRKARLPCGALFGRAEALDEEARDYLAAGGTLAEQSGALDNRGFLACNLDVRAWLEEP